MRRRFVHAARATRQTDSAPLATERDQCVLLAGVAGEPYEPVGKDAALKIGIEFVIDDGPKLILLATSRESYGYISALITRARMRAAKGSYRLIRKRISITTWLC